jgi:hypothetical protein
MVKHKVKSDEFEIVAAEGVELFVAGQNEIDCDLLHLWNNLFLERMRFAGVN